jgi:hypothetical protein
MERTVTLLATGLAIAPAFYLAGFVMAARMTRGSTGTDSGIAAGYTALVTGFLFAAVGFALVWMLASRYLSPGMYRPALIVDAILVVGWVVAWNRFMSPTPAFEYPGHRAVLEVEVRAADTLLGDASAGGLAIDFVGGQDLSLAHPEAVRREDGVTVLPWETTPLRVDAWEVRVFVREAPSLFRLDLPKRPAASTEWSEWIAPAAAEGYATPPGLSLRYRFRLMPHGSG